MSEDFSSIDQIKLNVNTLQKDVDTILKHSGKLEDVLLELNELSNGMAQMIAIHEQKHNQHEKDLDRLITIMSKQDENIDNEIHRLEEKIDKENDSLHSRITSVQERIIEKIEDSFKEMNTKKDSDYDKLNNRIDRLEKWRWMVVGAYIAIVGMGAFIYKLIMVINTLNGLNTLL